MRLSAGVHATLHFSNEIDFIRLRRLEQMKAGPQLVKTLRLEADRTTLHMSLSFFSLLLFRRHGFLWLFLLIKRN